jgi:hypothetical protein
MDFLKIDLQEAKWRTCVDWFSSGKGHVVGSCECDAEPAGSVILKGIIKK